ncbi:helix-turn-helix domain-containing protein [Lacihabitans sp. CCS-44]|nr:helix-turn-helix domain-containing protein [Lacihabitans sp. CCS-44]
MTMMTFGKIIKISRESLHYSKEFLAFNTGISLKDISKIEFEELVPDESDLKILAKFLDIDFQEIQAAINQSNHSKLGVKPVRSIKLFYLAVGIGMFLPGLNILVALLFYAFNKHNLVVRLVGKRLILLQMFWSFLSILLILIYSGIIKINIRHNDSNGLFLLFLLIGGMILSNLLFILCKMKSLKNNAYTKISR